jgi:cytosine/adenosine deaminase-related metal-dependent hydrolase
VHNARSNMNNHVGYNDKLAAYRNLALGTDGIGADMFEELKFAFFKHRDAGGPMWPDSFTRFLWNGNHSWSATSARASAGSSRLQGRPDDLPLRQPDAAGAQNIGGHLAFGMGASAVDSVMVEAGMVYENRAFPSTWRRSTRRAQGRKTSTLFWLAVEAHGQPCAVCPVRRVSWRCSAISMLLKAR